MRLTIPFRLNKTSRAWILMGCLALAILAQALVVLPSPAIGPAGGWLLFVLAGFFFGAASPLKPPTWTGPTLVKGETIWFAMILALAFFLRTFRLHALPPGLFFDQGFEGYGALNILYRGWRPWGLVRFNFNAPPLLFYLLAAWFKICPPTQDGFLAFFVFTSIMGLFFFYGTIRQFTGASTSLLSLYVLSVMQWHILDSRKGYPTIQVPFYLFGTLFFVLQGLRSGKKRDFLAAGLFLGLGMWTYQSFKVVPLLVAGLVFYEGWRNPKAWRGPNRLKLGLFAGTAILVMSPVLCSWLQNGSLGVRESNLFIGNEVLREKSIRPLVQNLLALSLMFNSRGDPDLLDGVPGAKVLDDVTGFFFILGLFYACRHFRERSGFYPLWGLAVISLLGLLSLEATNTKRLLGMAPFVALLAAQAAMEFWNGIMPAHPKLSPWVKGLVAFLPLSVMALENFQAYFSDYPSEWGLSNATSFMESNAGKAVARWGDSYRYFVSPTLFHNYSFLFFSFFERNLLKPLDLLDDLAGSPKSGSPCFMLDPDQTGVERLLRDLFPGGRESVIIDGAGRLQNRFYFIPARDWENSMGLYCVRGGKTDGFLDASFPQGLPAGPFRGRFGGCLFVHQGVYRFKTASNGLVRMRLGGRDLSPDRPVTLAKGFYPVEFSGNWEGKGDCALAIRMTAEGRVSRLLGPGDFTPLNLGRGIRATYFDGWTGDAKKLGQEWDPVLNFTNGNDFSQDPAPRRILWEGRLKVAHDGLYRFILRTMDRASVSLDGVECIPLGKTESSALFLKKGDHPLTVDYFRFYDWNAGLSLGWIEPGQRAPVVIPPKAWGPTGFDQN